MSDIRDIQTPEMIEWLQGVIGPMVQEMVHQEIRQDGVGQLERKFNEHKDHAERRSGRLETALVEMAEAQKRTDERFEEMAEAQKRTDERFVEMAEAQNRTGERVGRLETALSELTEAQKRTEVRVEELAEAQNRTEVVVTNLAVTQKSLEHRMGLVTDMMGLEAEGEAEEVLTYTLEQKGYRLLESPYALAVNDTEIDIVIGAETPDGERVTVLAEVKARARLKSLRRWSGRLRNPAFLQLLADAGVVKPFLPYFIGLRVYQVVDDAARDLGIGVLDPNGERVAPIIIE